MTPASDPGGRRHLTILTGLLAVMGLLAVIALVSGDVGSVTAGGTVPPAPTVSSTGTQPTSTTVTTRPVPTTAAASPTTTPATTAATSTTTTSSTTTTTTTTTTTPLPVGPLTADEIRELVAPSIGFVTTLNGSGSGVLIGENLFVTNAHVVWPFERIGVLFPDIPGRRTGRVLAIDPFADLALVEIGGRVPLPPPVRLGTVSGSDRGEPLYVVGYPLPESFGPEPTIADATLDAILPWEFSGVRWIETRAPAVGGQSGGALVTIDGEVVGITTFGNERRLYASMIEDVEDVVSRLWEDPLTRGITVRRLPRAGGRRSLSTELEGPWDQSLYLSWVFGGVETEIAADRSDVRLTATDLGGEVIGVGLGELVVVWLGSLPSAVAVDAAHPGTITLTASTPLIALEDPDDGRMLSPGETVVGFVDVPGDRDFYYLDVTRPGSTLTIDVEARTRARISVYAPDDPDPLAVAEDRGGFFFSDPHLSVVAPTAGRYAITVEDIGAQFGPYALTVELSLSE